MKKVNIVTAFILSIAILPALIACKKDNTAIFPDSSFIDSSDAPFDSSSSSEPSIPPEEPPSSSAPPENPPPTVKPEQPSTPPAVPEQPTPPKTAKYICLTGNRVNLRKGAGTDYAVLASSNEGTVYALTEKIGNWYKTYYRNQVAYIHTSYAAVISLEKSENTQVEKVIAEGYKLLGTPYVYGAVRIHDGKGKLLAGFSVQKFDCSSLVQYIFYKGANKLLNVNTRTQIKQGKYVKPSDLQRGDCIFFTNAERQHKTGIERVGHVALYLGNNYILHTASDYACIEQISTKRWSYYIEARRFL